MKKKKIIIIEYAQFREMKDKMLNVLATLEDIRDGSNASLEALINEMKDALKLATGKVENDINNNSGSEILKIPPIEKLQKL